MEFQLEIRKLEAKNTLPEYHKTRFDSKLINANQSEEDIAYRFNHS